MTELTVWDRMEELLDRFGFHQYQVDDDRAVVLTPDTVDESGAGGMSILELVRGALGVPREAASFPPYMFWDGIEMGPVLNQIWSRLNAALNAEVPSSHEIVAWCYLPSERSVSDLRKVIKRAGQMCTGISNRKFTPRPIGSNLVGAESAAGAAINLFGIVHTMRQVSYGDLLSSVQDKKRTEIELIGLLESRLSANERLEARCDTVSPIPQLLSRSYFSAAKLAASQSSRLGLYDYIASLEEVNNLAGLSDTALCKRLLQTLPTNPGLDDANIPQPLQKKISKYLVGA